MKFLKAWDVEILIRMLKYIINFHLEALSTLLPRCNHFYATLENASLQKFISRNVNRNQACLRKQSKAVAIIYATSIPCKR